MLLICDLDGVLLDARDLHYEALNEALTEVGIAGITRADHLSTYDGLSTRQKLERMQVPSHLADAVSIRKQALTVERIAAVPRDDALIALVNRLHREGHRVVVASNAKRATVELALDRLGLAGLPFLSAEDVKWPKPNPAIYLTIMVAFGMGPHETVIVEDSPHGRQAAEASGARVVPVLSPADVTYERIMDTSPQAPTKWRTTMNVVIPMAGAGSRFERAGYTFPKPLIEVAGKPMIQTVVENLGLDAHFVFICQRAHVERYNLRQMLHLIAPGCDVLETDGVTEGAACTVLLASDLIDNDTPLLIANADQVMEWDPTDFYWWTANTDADGAILTHTATHPKWSFARTVGDQVVEVAEKRPISDQATCGVYWWRRGARFVTCAESMIQADVRTNGEFYVAPVYNQAIAMGDKILTWPVDAMWGLGTPEDLRTYVEQA